MKRSTFFKNLASLTAAAFIPFKMAEAKGNIPSKLMPEEMRPLNWFEVTDCYLITGSDPEPDYGKLVHISVENGDVLQMGDIVVSKKIVGMITTTYHYGNIKKAFIYIRSVDPYTTFDVKPGEYIKRIVSQKGKYILKSRSQCQDINKNNAP